MDIVNSFSFFSSYFVFFFRYNNVRYWKLCSCCYCYFFFLYSNLSVFFIIFQSVQWVQSSHLPIVLIEFYFAFIYHTPIFVILFHRHSEQKKKQQQPIEGNWLTSLSKCYEFLQLQSYNYRIKKSLWTQIKWNKTNKTLNLKTLKNKKKNNVKQLKMYSKIRIQYEIGSDSTELQIYILI